MSMVYMGQIMAECDCQNRACEIRGYCMAEKIKELEVKLKTSEEIGRAFEEDAGQLRAKLAKAVLALRLFKYFDDMPLSAKRPDVFERKVRPPILATLAEIEEETK